MALFSLKPDSKMQGFSNWVQKTGAYQCKINSAVNHVNEQTGSKSILLQMETKEGQNLDVYLCYEYATIDAAGMQRAQSQIESIMMCAGIQELDPDKNGIFQALCGKYLGVVVQREESLDKKTKQVREGVVYKGCFDCKTKQTASEKQSNAQAVELDRFVATLVELKPLKNPVVSAVNHALPPMPSSAVHSAGVDDDFSSDVPF